ncbi:sulfurtransferase tusA [Micromonospora echinospora]|uniref:tRNA 2-thiouridine synthesizing protein A n=1 Tax=Micromonospora echinospora TaxID=1877 RepID=A0A1C4ZPV0_MICEC|nr:sulfurtransferase tusA [Micromonospora echinospora]OZV81672.1 sulfurtransferase tusA [Micromonospora echinospora]SCF35033.1 tRNA 2-thiouridine synthesizing protein A [Micromonospora echinospora]
MQLLIELRRLTVAVPPGTVIHLVATDPAALLDLPAWCHLTGHPYLGPVDGAERPTYAMRTTAGSVPTDPVWPWTPYHEPFSGLAATGT